MCMCICVEVWDGLLLATLTRLEFDFIITRGNPGPHFTFILRHCRAVPCAAVPFAYVCMLVHVRMRVRARARRPGAGRRERRQGGFLGAGSQKRSRPLPRDPRRARPRRRGRQRRKRRCGQALRRWFGTCCCCLCLRLRGGGSVRFGFLPARHQLEGLLEESFSAEQQFLLSYLVLLSSREIVYCKEVRAVVY
jgi:hypothetical protein